MRNQSPDHLNRATRVLLADTNRWDLAARVAIGLVESGCEVSAICPQPGHPLMKTRVVKHTFAYSGLRPVDSIESAVVAAKPDVVIPSCERSVEHLHELYLRVVSRGESGKNLAALIERSLGSPASYQVVCSRHDLIKLARAEGVRAPDTVKMDTEKDLMVWRAKTHFPWVLKTDGTWGGVGVKVVQSADQIDESLRQLAQMSRLSRAIKRALVNRDHFPFWTWWQGLKRPIVIQAYVHGRPGNCTAFAWKGEVLALIGVEVICSDGPNGPASVVRVVENSEMKFAAERIASRLGLTGFFGLDFMIEEETGWSYLIEMNPRLTPPCHLRLGKGRDLIGALCTQLAGRPLPDCPPVTECEVIAYRPEERFVNNIQMSTCYHDVPKGEPDLLREIQNPFPDRTVLFRFAQRIARMTKDSQLGIPVNRDRLKASRLPQDLK